MASVVKIKRSSIRGKAPTTSNITTGELALNLADGRLYSSNGTSVFEIGANTHSLAVGSGGFSIANGQLTFPTTDGNSGQVLQTDGEGQLYFGTVGSGGVVSSPAEVKTFKFTATEGQQSFVNNDDYGDELAYTEDNIQVFLNGILQVANTDYEASNTTSIWFTEPVSNADIVTVQSFAAVSEFVNVQASMVGNSASTDTATQVVADSFRILDFRSAKYMVQVSSRQNLNQFQSTEVMLVHNGSATFMTEYATISTSGTPIANVSSDISGTSVRLLVTPNVANTEVKVVRLGVTR